MSKQKFTIEYMIRSSPAILYNFLTTPSGLIQWFSESCDINGDIYTFGWEGSMQDATIIEDIENEVVKFRWDDADEEEYFGFEITKSEISNDTVLYVTDFAEDYDVEDQKRLWDSQIQVLTQQIGA